MVTVGQWAAFAAGVGVLVGTLTSIVVTFVVPRGVQSRITRLVEGTIGRGYTWLALRPADYEARDRLLAFLAPLDLLALLAAWLLLIMTGYALVFWPLAGDLGTAWQLAGSAMLTLGFATSPATGGGVTAVTFGAAATGLVAVALLISYLPTLYAAYNRRETLVTMLESRGGAPVWGPEILARHRLVDIVDNLPQFYADWERWAADVAESHTNYPILLYFRSPHPLRGWVIALVSVLDAAALHHALFPDTAPSECRLVLRMGFTALREVAQVLDIDFDPDPRPDAPIELGEAEYRLAVQHIVEAGWRPEREVDEGWRHFRGWRVNYESVAYAIADRVLSPPALWSGPRPSLGDVGAHAPERPVDRRPVLSLERRELIESSSRRQALRGDGAALAARRAAAERAARALLDRELRAAQAIAGAPPDPGPEADGGRARAGAGSQGTAGTRPG